MCKEVTYEGTIAHKNPVIIHHVNPPTVMLYYLIKGAGYQTVLRTYMYLYGKDIIISNMR